jgi:plasmid stabilization system protein ParE
MKHAVLIVPEAMEDIAEIMEFYGSEDRSLAQRFMAALRTCFRGLEENPYLSTPFLRDEIRRVFLKKWPYHIYFRVASSAEVRVQAVIHTSRDPRYITKRTARDQ